MALNLPSDIVLEVARAADPEAARSVTSRLTQLGETAGTQSGDFSQVLDGLRPPPSDVWQKASQWTAPEIHDQSGTTRPSGRAQVYQHFEAMILQNLFQLMMPQDSEGIFGKGTAGEMWKSMLAEQLGTQVAKSDRSGLFSRLFASADRDSQGSATPTGGGAAAFGTLEGATRSFGERS